MKSSTLPIALLLVLSLLLNINTNAQLIAPAIVATDCNGVEHNLYDKINQGKIIVIGWTMPCPTCVNPLVAVHNSVVSFNQTHPNSVEYWVADDYANSPCAAIIGWCNDNNITNATYFSSPQIKMMDFGSNGMPKVVVIGCSNGEVFYNVNNNPSGADVLTVLDSVHTKIANGCATGVFTEEIIENQSAIEIQIFPNPAQDIIRVEIPEEIITAAATINIINSLGQVVYQKAIQNKTSLSIDISHLENAHYVLSITTKSQTINKRFVKNQW